MAPKLSGLRLAAGALALMLCAALANIYAMRPRHPGAAGTISPAPVFTSPPASPPVEAASAPAPPAEAAEVGSAPLPEVAEVDSALPPAPAPPLALPSPSTAAPSSGTLWPLAPALPAEPWSPCYCLHVGGTPTTIEQMKALTRPQTFDDFFLRTHASQPIGPRTPWARCAGAPTAGRCATPLPPARSGCGSYRLRLRSAPETVRAGAVIELELVGVAAAGGAECRPSGDYFQIWIEGPAPSGKPGSIAGEKKNHR